MARSIFAYAVVAAFISMPLVSLAAASVSYTGSGAPLSPLAVNGSGFAAGENVTVLLGGSTLGSAAVDGGGSFHANFTVPNLPSNTYPLIATGSVSSSFAISYLYVSGFYPVVNPNTYYILPGQTLNFSGSGFAAGEAIKVFEGTATVPVATFNVSGAGDFTNSGSVLIPYNFANSSRTYALAGQLSGARIQLPITVGQLYPSANPSAYYVMPGSFISFSGSGFGHSEAVDVLYGSNILSTINTDATGAFSGAGLFQVPFSSAGSSLNLILTGRDSGAQALVNITVGALYPEISPSSYYILPGHQITITGSGFAPNETVDININGNITGVSANSSGGFTSALITIPFGVPGNSLNIVAKGQTSGAQVTSTITLASYYPYVEASGYYVSPGTNISFSGSGFGPNEDVLLKAGGATVATLHADGSGTLASNSVTVPFGSTGSIHYVFKGQLSGAEASINIGIAGYYPWVALDNYYSVGGTPVTVNGSGFAPGETVNVTFGGAAFGSTTADGSGAYSLTGNVPFAAEGTKIVRATGALSAAIAETTFTQAPVYTSIYLSSYASAPGAAITFIGSGYLPNEPMEIRTDRTGSAAVYSFNADASGNFNNSGYHIPAGFIEGNLSLMIKGLHSLSEKTIVYYVTGI